MKHSMFWIGCLAAALGAMPAHAVEPVAPPSFAFNHAGQRIATLDKQIAERLALLPLADPLTTESIRASINYRIIAKTLLSKGREAGEAGAVAMLCGHRLMRHQRDADRLFEQLPQWIRTADSDPMAKKQRDAVRAFNGVAAQEADALAAIAPAAVDRYLLRLFAPLAMHGVPPSAWRSNVVPKPVAGLSDRVEKSPVSGLIKAELLALDRLIKSPRTDSKTSTALSTALSIGQGLDQNRWIGSEPHGRLTGELHTAVLLSKDRRTLDSALQKLNTLQGTLKRIASLREIANLATPVEPMLKMVLTNHHDLMQQRNPQAAQADAQTLDRLLLPMVGFRSRLGRELPLPLRVTAREVRKRYQQAELILLGVAAEPSSQPSALTQRHDNLKQLENAYDHLRYIYAIPQWVRQLKRFKPRNPNSLLHQMTQTAKASLKDGPDAQTARQHLQTLDLQLHRFDPMPHLGQLRAADAKVQSVTQGSESMILAQTERTQKAWASAYAAGEDPRETARRLGLLHRMLGNIHDATAAQNLSQSAAALNQWAAWDAPVSESTERLKHLNQMIAQAGLLASVGNWAKLEIALDHLEKEMASLLLVGRLTAALQLKHKPEHLTLNTLLGQTLHKPSAQAYATQHRQTLAKICLHHHEARAARDAGHADEALLSSNRASQLALALLRQLD